MDPQIEEYRRKQRERATTLKTSTNVPVGVVKQSWPLLMAVVCAAALVAMVHSQSTQSVSPLAGTCPKPVGVGVCVEECSKHEDCQGQGKLCCSNGCGHVCQTAVAEAQKGHESKCTLMVTLAAAGDTAATIALQAVPKPHSSQHLSAVGILLLEYAAGRSSECCEAERALQAMPDAAKFVEYDGTKPGCASESSKGVGEVSLGIDAGLTDAVGPTQEAEEPMMGAWSRDGGNNEIDEESLAVWQQVLAKSSVHENHNLKEWGPPVSVKTQVVAGTNYQFTFRSGGSVTVFHQPWTDTLEVSEVLA